MTKDNLLKRKIIVICGPTGVGKTDLGIRLCKKFNGEVISTDSRQIYKEMDIGTGKDLPLDSRFQIRDFKPENKRREIGYYKIKGIKVWLYNIVEPNYFFNASDFNHCAKLVIEDIQKRDKNPFLVGGTGLYLKAILKETEIEKVEPDWKLRKKLEKETLADLQFLLQKLNNPRFIFMNDSDKKNKRRIIRAIEIEKNLRLKRFGKAESFFRKAEQIQSSKPKRMIFKSEIEKVLKIGLIAERDWLYPKVDERIDQMIKQGLVKEIQGLLEKGYEWSLPSMSAIGYRQFKPFFENEKTLEDCIQQLKWDTHAYIRRQETWFKKDKEIIWFDVRKKNYFSQINQAIKSYFNK